MGTKGVKKVLSFWWARIFIYSMLCSLFFIGLFLIPDNIIVPPVIFVFLTVLCFLIPGLLIEGLRAGGKAFTLGFRIDKNLIKEFLTSLIMCCLIFGSIIVISLIGGADYYYNTGWEDFTAYLWNTIILLLFYALTEELIFRGLVFQTLSQRFNPDLITVL
jgi:membrane protease YdiL (CAAX protease family)